MGGPARARLGAKGRRRGRALVSRALAVTLVAAAVSLAPGSPALAATALGAPLPWPKGPRAALQPAAVHARALDDARCQALYGLHCYSPAELARAYRIDQLWANGDTGRGTSIVLVDAFGSPTLARDLRRFDAAYGLPPPPSLEVLAPLGTVAFDPSRHHMAGWAAETSLDVEWAHAVAPGARLVVLTSPVDETEGVKGLPQFLALERYAYRHHLGQVLSQSWGAAESTLLSPQGRGLMARFDDLYRRLGSSVTVLASSGDTGAAGLPTGRGGRSVEFPASSPFVTAVGGTTLDATTQGRYRAERAWDDAEGATGGGVSVVAAEPRYQRRSAALASDQALLKGHRGVPDVAMVADPETGLPVYESFPSATPGFEVLGGTSAGSPIWAGLVADLDQEAGRPLGFLNPSLYLRGALRGVFERSWLHDVVVGTNAFAGVPGYRARPGWDPTTGFGTPDVVEATSPP